MTFGELIVRTTIWLALVLYAAAEIGRLRWRNDCSAGYLLALSLSTSGCVLYLIHVLAAFGVFHSWSHGDAYQFTAEQTEQLVGWRWGGGLFVNYLFTTVWLAELIAGWIAPQVYRTRAAWIDLSIRIFFAFMIANGAVVFVVGIQRWLGVGIIVLLGWGFFRFRR
ncbi:MAG: hypothetical protein ACI9R3_004020 [Verrucomicrobiales bacterium]|jgi:hypothetical protein